MDELRELWARNDDKLDRALSLNETLLRTLTADRAKSALAGLERTAIIEACLGGVATILTGIFLANHVDALRYFSLGVAVLVYAVALTAMATRRLVLLGRVDFCGSVTSIQRAIESIKLSQYRAFKVALLGGILLWAPIPILMVKGFLGVDLLAELDNAWLLSNIALGVLLIFVGQWWSRRYVEREDTAPFARKLIDALSGRDLERASSFLRELASFEGR